MSELRRHMMCKNEVRPQVYPIVDKYSYQELVDMYGIDLIKCFDESKLPNKNCAFVVDPSATSIGFNGYADNGTYEVYEDGTLLGTYGKTTVSVREGSAKYVIANSKQGFHRFLGITNAVWGYVAHAKFPIFAQANKKLLQVFFLDRQGLNLSYDAALDGCSSLADALFIPLSVNNIAAYSLRNTTWITKIYYEGTEEQWNAISKNSSWGGANKVVYYEHIYE